MPRKKGDLNKRPAMQAHQVRLPDELWERLTAVAGEAGRAEFIRNAIERALEVPELKVRVARLETRDPQGD